MVEPGGPFLLKALSWVRPGKERMGTGKDEAEAAVPQGSHIWAAPGQSLFQPSDFTGQDHSPLTWLHMAVPQRPLPDCSRLSLTPP